MHPFVFLNQVMLRSPSHVPLLSVQSGVDGVSSVTVPKVAVVGCKRERDLAVKKHFVVDLTRSPECVTPICVQESGVSGLILVNAPRLAKEAQKPERESVLTVRIFIGLLGGGLVPTPIGPPLYRKSYYT